MIKITRNNIGKIEHVLAENLKRSAIMKSEFPGVDSEQWEKIASMASVILNGITKENLELIHKRDWEGKHLWRPKVYRKQK